MLQRRTFKLINFRQEFPFNGFDIKLDTLETPRDSCHATTPPLLVEYQLQTKGWVYAPAARTGLRAAGTCSVINAPVTPRIVQP